MNTLKFEAEFSERLDVWLSEQTKRSRSFIKNCTKNSQILINNKPAKPAQILKLGDIIEYDLSEQKLPLPPADIKLDFVYEDQHLIVINKPAGLTVHPGAGNKTNTLVNALLNHNQSLSSSGGLERPGIVHRLDKDTSGLIIVAKNNDTHNLLAKMFANREIQKIYLALVRGKLESNHGFIDAPLTRMANNYKKMGVNFTKGKASLTEYEVLKEQNEKSLVKITLHTGRTHQIRAHFAYLGHPLVGDPLYGSIGKTGKQLLHSYELIFTHPITKQQLALKTELPSWAN